MSILLTLFLATIFLASVLLEQAYRALPLKELKRRARSGQDIRSNKIYRMASYGQSLEILLWLSGSLSLAVLLVIAAQASTLAAIAFVLLASWLFVKGRHYHKTGGKLWSLAAGLAPIASGLLSHLQPFLGRAAKITGREEDHHHIFEKEDLVEFLQRQIHKSDNRLSEADLRLAAGALTFSDNQVVDVMQPTQDVRLVSQDEPIGPLLMDELHKTGNKYFPVVERLKSTQPIIVGTLYLKDIMMYEGHGRISDVMKREVNYINESQSLHEVLNAFIKTQSHMFVVTNNFEEIIGVVSIDKLLEQITGQRLEDDFESYDNLLAVAGLDSRSSSQKQVEATEA